MELFDIGKKLNQCSTKKNLECIGINCDDGIIKEYKEYYFGKNIDSEWVQEQYRENQSLDTYGYSIGIDDYNNTERLTFRVKNYWDIYENVLKNQLPDINYAKEILLSIRELIFRLLNTHKEPIVQIGFKKEEKVIKLYFTLRQFMSPQDYKGAILDYKNTESFFEELADILEVTYSIDQLKDVQKMLNSVGFYPSLMSLEIEKNNIMFVKLYFELKEYNNQKVQLQKNEFILSKCGVSKNEYAMQRIFYDNGFYLRGMGFYISPDFKRNQIKYYYFPQDEK